MMFTQMKKIKAEYAKKGLPITDLVCHDSFVLDGWFFVVINGNRRTLLFNSKDLDHYRSKIAIEDLPDRIPELFDLPFYYNNYDVTMKTMKGVFDLPVRIDKSPPPF